MAQRQQGADMDTRIDKALIKLDKGELLRVRNGAGKGVAVFGGLVWITQDGDMNDSFASPGDAFVFDRPGLAVVQALSASRVLMFDAAHERAAMPD
jgi:hypothetical protein